MVFHHKNKYFLSKAQGITSCHLLNLEALILLLFTEQWLYTLEKREVRKTMYLISKDYSQVGSEQSDTQPQLMAL